MTTFFRLAAAAVLFGAVCQSPGAAGQAPVPATTLTVPDLDCPSCAKKLAAKLVEVAGVAKVEPDVEKKTVKITHKAGEKPSPKSLWEVSEKAGQTPSKLEGPDGTFSAKPAK